MSYPVTARSLYKKRNSQTRLEFSERKFLLRAGDIGLVGLGILGALWAWSRFAGREFGASLLRDQAMWIGLIALGWLGWLSLNDLYELRRAVRLRFCLQRILLGGFFIGLAYILYYFITAIPPSSSITVVNASDISTPLRLAPAAAILATTALLAFWRSIYAGVLGTPHARRRVLILGAGAAGNTLAEVLRGHSHFDVLGFIDDDERKIDTSMHEVPVLGSHPRLLDISNSRNADEIVVAISAAMTGSLFQAVMDCHERGIAITPMPLLYEQLTGKVAVEHIGSQWYVALPFETNPFGSIHRLGKRLLDLICGLLISIVFVITLPFVALAIKLSSPGPVFYRQERMGLHGKPFVVTKYRSMVQDAERDGKAKWAIKNDTRITRIGRIMRRTRIDELPQVINILKGDMSMVGPRPERPQFIEQLQRQIPFYRTRLAAKPGLTGWAQVSHGYGATVEDALIKLQYDLFYIKHQSLWFDLKIMLRTVAVVLKMKGQ